jgi:pyruvate dehydrogenase (quinone)
MLKQKTDKSWSDEIGRNVKSWWQTLKERAMNSAEPLNPQRVFYELSPRLPDNAIITADSGSVANWYARDLKMRRGMKASLSGGLASLGAGTPYALAGKMAFPDRTVIACMGDGAMQMNGLNVMITISKYWKKWSNPRLIVLVLNNRDLNQVTWEERIQLGEGKTESTQSIPDFPYHRYAELLGLKGIFVNHPDKVGAAWDEALSADRPVILEAYTDPNVPPLPPHITLKDAKNFMMMMRDEPELGSVLKNSAKELLTSIVPSSD